MDTSRVLVRSATLEAIAWQTVRQSLRDQHKRFLDLSTRVGGESREWYLKRAREAWEALQALEKQT